MLIADVGHGHADHRAEQAHRHHQNHGQRQGPTFVQGRQGQKDEDHGQAEDVHRRVAGANLHQRQFGPFGLHRPGKRRPGHAVDRLNRLAGAESGIDAAVDRRGRIEVVARDHHGPIDAAHVDQRVERDHLAAGVADLDLVDVFDLIAERAVGHDVDLPVAAEGVEVVHVQRAEIDLQRLVQVVDRHAHRADLGPVDVHVQLRRVRAEHREDADQPGKLVQALPGCRCFFARRASPRALRSSTINLKPLAMPMPGTGGAPNTLTMRCGFRWRIRLRSRAMMASACRSGCAAIFELDRGSRTSSRNSSCWPSTGSTCRKRLLSAGLPWCAGQSPPTGASSPGSAAATTNREVAR